MTWLVRRERWRAGGREGGGGPDGQGWHRTKRSWCKVKGAHKKRSVIKDRRGMKEELERGGGVGDSGFERLSYIKEA